MSLRFFEKQAPFVRGLLPWPSPPGQARSQRHAKTKIPSSTTGTKEFLRGTTRFTSACLNVSPSAPANVTLFAVTGLPGAGYVHHPVTKARSKTSCPCAFVVKVHQRGPLRRISGRQASSATHALPRALRRASTSLSLLADGTAYYSCRDHSIWFHIVYEGRDCSSIPALAVVDPGGLEPPTFSMPLRRAPSCAMGPGQFWTFDFRFAICTIFNRQSKIWWT